MKLAQILRAGRRKAPSISLRHFFATTLMSNGVEPQEAQKALRHANLRITLDPRPLAAEGGPTARPGR
ncbi:hypothetical protein [Micromonospora gifhornensis]|uniref:hypothetical protein n=1 Tax=Micromonospora gifhornensis TaxID=84594 RepID=UPI003D73D831